MKKWLAVLISALAALVGFVAISSVWFYYAPLSWIYTAGNALALQGDESTLNLLLISGWLVALLPALLVAFGVYRWINRKT